MRAKIIDADFSKGAKWLFKAEADNGTNYHILTDNEYRKHKLRSPIKRWHLDSLMVGDSVELTFKEINSENIIVGFKKINQDRSTDIGKFIRLHGGGKR